MAGRNSAILLNANGAFFSRTSQVMQLGPGGTFEGLGGNLTLTISGYNRDTRETQLTILLHELGQQQQLPRRLNLGGEFYKPRVR